MPPGQTPTVDRYLPVHREMFSIETEYEEYESCAGEHRQMLTLTGPTQSAAVGAAYKTCVCPGS